MSRFTSNIMTVAGMVAFAATLGASPLAAQKLGPGRGNEGIPPGHRPPPGMCRIWIDGVPPGQQPAPTDCATAVRNRPANGRVIFGDDAGNRGKGKGKKGRPSTYDRGGWYGDRDDDGRYDDRRRDDRRRNDSDLCVDRDRNGVCDYRQNDGGTVLDGERARIGGDIGRIIDSARAEQRRRRGQ